MCAKKTAATTKIVTPAAKQRAMSKTIDKKPMEADKKQLTASKKKKSELISSEASNSKILSRATPAKAPTAKPPKTAKPVGDEKINEANKVVKLPSAKPNDAKANTIDPDKSCGNNKLNRMSDTKTNAKSDEIKSKNNKSKLDCNADKSLVKPNEKVDDNTKNSDKTEVTGTVKKVVAKSKAKPDKLGVQSKISPKPKFINVKKKVVKKREPKIKISKELKNLGVELSKSSAIAASPTSTSSDVKTSICEMVKTKTRTPNYFGKPSASVQGDDAKAKKLNKDAKPKPDKQPKSDSGKKSEAPVAAELSAVLPAETVKNAAACNVKSKKAVPKAVKSEVEVKVAESLEKIVEPIITEKLIADEPKKILSPPVSVVTTPKKKCNPKKIDLKVNSDNSEVKSSEISVLPKKVRKYNKKKSLEADPNLTSSEVKKLPPEKSKTRKYVKKKMKDSNLLETESKTVNIAKEPKAKKQKSKPIAAVEPLEKDLKIVQKEEVVEDEQEIETVKIIMKDVEELIVKNVHEVSKLFELVPINNGLHFDGILKPLAAPVLKNPFNTESVKIEKLKRKYVRKNFNPKLQSKTISKPSKSPNKILGSKLIKLKKHSSSKTNHSDSSIKVKALPVESEDQKPNNLAAQPEPIKDIKVKTPVKTLKQESSETQSDIKKEVHTPTIIPIPPPKKENKYEKTSEAANKKKMAAKILEPTKEVVGIKDECIEKMIVAKIIEKVASNKSTEDTKNVEQKLSPIKKVEQKVSTPKKVVDQKPLTPKKVEQKPATPKKVDQKPITPKKSEQKSPVSKKIEQKPLTQKKYDQDPLKTESSDNNLESDSEDNYSESGYTKPKRQAVRTSVRNRKHKQKQMCPKRSRVASLNAMAKVHCLYENESRSALETNLFNAEKISQATQRIKQNVADSGSSEGDDNDESESTKAPDEKRFVAINFHIHKCRQISQRIFISTDPCERKREW